MIFVLRALLFITWFAITILAFLPDYSDLPPIVTISDLINHAVAFLTLYLLYRNSYFHSVKRIVLTLLLYAVFIEVVQAFLPTRSASITDIGADMVGLLLALLIDTLGKTLSPSSGKLRA